MRYLIINDKIAIREMVESDCTVIANAFEAQGWNKPAAQYLHYFQESVENKRVVLVAEYEGQFAGYVTIVWVSGYPPFRTASIPEISDFNILLKYRRMKIGTALMDEAENQIAARSPVAGIGVGIEADYGAAQVLYVKRGYIPDGRGVFSHDRYPKYGEQIRIDDHLTLYLLKSLSKDWTDDTFHAWAAGG